MEARIQEVEDKQLDVVGKALKAATDKGHQDIITLWEALIVQEKDRMSDPPTEDQKRLIRRMEDALEKARSL